jgi:hypothetical protein
MNNGLRWWVGAAGAALFLMVLAPGCQSAPHRTASAEPGLTASPTLGEPVEPGGTAVASASGGSWVDHHPLFWKPRHYYDSTQSNKVVKVGVATVIGVPAGVFGEIRQIVTGAPGGTKY